jgi:hypothetical protein
VKEAAPRHRTLVEDRDLGFMSIFLVLATMLDWERRMERLRALISAAVVQARLRRGTRLGVKRGIDAEWRREGGCSRTKCIKEERGKAFLHLLSS